MKRLGQVIVEGIPASENDIQVAVTVQVDRLDSAATQRWPVATVQRFQQKQPVALIQKHVDRFVMLRHQDHQVVQTVAIEIDNVDLHAAGTRVQRLEFELRDAVDAVGLDHHVDAADEVHAEIRNDQIQVPVAVEI